MIKFRQSEYSDTMSTIHQATSKLDSLHIEDYEISEEIPADTISVNADLKAIRINVPEDLDYDVNDLDNYIRKKLVGVGYRIDMDRDLTVLSLRSPIRINQYVDLLKYIIELEDFCTIIKD